MSLRVTFSTALRELRLL